jgi:hypothetical protein
MQDMANALFLRPDAQANAKATAVKTRQRKADSRSIANRSADSAARSDRLSAMQKAESEALTRGESRPSQLRRARSRAAIRADVAAGRKVAGAGNLTQVSERDPNAGANREALIQRQIEEYRQKELARRFRNSPGALGDTVRGLEGANISPVQISRYLLSLRK